MTAQNPVTKGLNLIYMKYLKIYKKDIIEETGSLHGLITILNRYQKP
jgi:hypothetical protein